jgi:hypothetical protein
VLESDSQILDYLKRVPVIAEARIAGITRFRRMEPNLTLGKTLMLIPSLGCCLEGK